MGSAREVMGVGGVPSPVRATFFSGPLGLEWRCKAGLGGWAWKGSSPSVEKPSQLSRTVTSTLCELQSGTMGTKKAESRV